MKRKKLLGLGLGCGILGFTAFQLQAQTTPFNATYTFSGVTTSSGTSDPTPPPVTTGVGFSIFTAVGYSGNPNAAGRFSWTGNEIGGVNGDDNFADFTGALNSTKYFEVTLTPLGAFTLNLDSISFGVRRSTTGIRSYSVRSSLDGFAANLPATINPGNTNLGVGPDNSFRWLLDGASTANDQSGSRAVPGSAFDALVTPLTIRIYGWNAESTSGTFSIDDVLFSGSVTAVPEPTTASLWVLGTIWLGMTNRRRLIAAMRQNASA